MSDDASSKYCASKLTKIFLKYQYSILRNSQKQNIAKIRVFKFELNLSSLKYILKNFATIFVHRDSSSFGDIGILQVFSTL